jgi:transcriptional regulator with XRE-family HTH domain
MPAREFRAARERLGLTQSAFAEALGLHPNTVARMERGELPVSVRTAKMVALLLE